MSIIEKLKSLSAKQAKRIVALALMLSLGISSAISVAALSKNFRITDGDNVINIRTLYSEVDQVLKQAGITLGENDKVIVTNKEANYTDIDIKRAFSVKVFFDGKSQCFTVNDGTVGDVLSNNNIAVKENDVVSPAPDTILTPDMHIIVSKPISINLSFHGESKSVVVPEGSISNALDFLNISLSQDDIVNESLDRLVENGLNIIIGHVEYKEVCEKESIPFSTSTKKTDSLNKGETKIETPGSNGEKEVTKRIKYIDGNPIQTDIISENILKNPTTEIKLVGTKVNNANFNISNGTINDGNGNIYSYKTVLSGVCTAYHERPGARTSTGKIAKRGLVAVNPKQIPYGTKLFIPGYGVCVAEDTGGAMRKGHAMIDLYMDSEQECRNFGRRTKQIYILN